MQVGDEQNSQVSFLTDPFLGQSTSQQSSDCKHNPAVNIYKRTSLV